jgi:hypothetical protein
MLSYNYKLAYIAFLADRALSSEVEAGSLKKTRQIKNLESRSDSLGTEKDLARCGA